MFPLMTNLRMWLQHLAKFDGFSKTCHHGVYVALHQQQHVCLLKGRLHKLEPGYICAALPCDCRVRTAASEILGSRYNRSS